VSKSHKPALSERFWDLKPLIFGTGKTSSEDRPKFNSRFPILKRHKPKITQKERQFMVDL
jgi:hypothetical protein